MAYALDLSLRGYSALPLGHSHDFHQIVLPVEGSLDMEIAGRGGCVAGCQAALIAAGQTHSCRSLAPNRFVVLDWHDADAGGSDFARLWDFSERRPYLVYDSGLQHLVRFLGASLSKRGDDARVRGWAALLLSELADHVLPDSAAKPRQAGRAVTYMQSHLGDPIGVDDIARAACVSASHLYALFRRHLGVSPMDHLAELRLDQAMALLAAGDTPIGDIALRTGHADQSVLTRSMRRRRGITPAAYRRRIRGMTITA